MSRAWILINSRLHAFRLDGMAHVSNQLNRLFVLSVAAPTDCTSPETKDECYRESSQLLRTVLLPYVGVVADDFNVQVGDLAKTERTIHYLRRSH